MRCHAVSQGFLRFLGLVLAVGNQLNAGTQRGHARGFDLRGLAKLSLVKSADRQSTLLRFLAAFVEANGPRTAHEHLSLSGGDVALPWREWWRELSHVKLARGLTFERAAAAAQQCEKIAIVAKQVRARARTAGEACIRHVIFAAQVARMRCPFPGGSFGEPQARLARQRHRR